MRCALLTVFVLAAFALTGQESTSLKDPKSIFNDLRPGDSLTVYQCHVDVVRETLTTSSGQTFTAAGKKCTITEKFVIRKNSESYSANYYTTQLTAFPNRKFSGLKIKERPYWQFASQKTIELGDEQMKIFFALEKKGREANEFDYGISKYNTNQVIFKHGSNFKQLVITTDHVISKLLSL
jgi:hypothetical protein